MSVAKKDYKRITVKTLVDMKQNGEKISMLTAYDYTMAKIVDGAGIDLVLMLFWLVILPVMSWQVMKQHYLLL